MGVFAKLFGHGIAELARNLRANSRHHKTLNTAHGQFAGFALEE